MYKLSWFVYEADGKCNVSRGSQEGFNGALAH